MLLWPPSTQTSPTNTFLQVTVLVLPFTTRSRGSVLLSSGSNSAAQVPSAAAVAVFVWPANSTVTASPSSAQPHTRTGFARCSTMLLSKM